MGNLLYIVWNEKNNIGVPIIDEQHRGIVIAINSLYYFINERRANEAFPRFPHCYIKLEASENESDHGQQDDDGDDDAL